MNHEIADPRFKAVTGSLGYISLGIGVVIGILMVVMMVSLVPPAQLLVWGWRLPFLFAIVTLVAAALLSYNMPESTEFATSREEFDEDYHRRLKEQALKHSNSRSLGSRTYSRSRSQTDGTAVASPESFDTTPNKDFAKGDVAAVVEGGDVESSGSLERHYVPVLELVRGYWGGLALQMGYEAWIGGSFYLRYSWLPSFFVEHVGLSTMLTLWMVLTSMVIFTFVVPIAGVLSDRGTLRPVTATIGICVVAAGVSVPMFLAFQTKQLAACWLLQIASLCMTAYSMGILPVICSNIYPAGVRISGFKLGYNLGMTAFGGLTPLVTTAIQTGTGSIFIGPGLWMTLLAVISVVCSVLLMKIYPLTNTVN